MMAEPSDEVYEGQIVGIHSRDNDLVVNPLKGKKLTNMRASGSDEHVILVPAVKFALEPALEFINHDEQIGRAHVRTPVTNAHLGWRPLLQIKTHNRQQLTTENTRKHLML